MSNTIEIGDMFVEMYDFNAGDDFHRLARTVRWMVIKVTPTGRVRVRPVYERLTETNPVTGEVTYDREGIPACQDAILRTVETEHGQTFVDVGVRLAYLQSEVSA